MRFVLPTLMMIGMFLTVGCQQPTKPAGFAAFGEPIQTKGAMPLADAVTHVDDYAGKPVLVKANIADVCARMGCWMLLKDGDHRVRVRFTASEKCTEGFLVPRNAADHAVYVKGVLKREQISEELARHYAEETGKPTDTITGPQEAVTMLASGVMISDAKTLDPPVK